MTWTGRHRFFVLHIQIAPARELHMSIHGAHRPTNSPRAQRPGAVGPSPLEPSPLADGAPTPVVRVRGLTKRFHTGIPGCSARVEAVRSVDFDLAEGDAVGILGPAGAGKSTLLLCLAGLLRPDAGTVSWFGRVADDAGCPPGIAYVPERATHYPFMTVREAAEYHAVLHDIAGECRASAIAEALEQTGLSGVASVRVGDLSWSVGPLLSLAQALISRPRVLLLDETLSGLDPTARREISAMLRSLGRRGTTIVAAAATLDTLDGLAMHVAVMAEGRLTPPIAPADLERPRVLELVVATPALARRIFGTRVAETPWDRHLLRLPLEGTTAEAVLARCRSFGIRVESSRVVAVCADDTTFVTHGTDAPWAAEDRC